MKIIELYKSILKTANLFATEDGYINQIMAQEKTPAVVKGKTLVLPTPEHLANPNWDNRVVFHPLSENVLRSESDVLEKFRAGLNIRFNYTIIILVTELLRIAASVDEHAKLTPEQSEFLTYVKDVDQKTIDDFKKLADAMPIGQTSTSFVSIFLKRSGTVKGKRHQRCGIVSFPLYTELVNVAKNRVVYGVTLRAKDIKSLMSLFDWMLPGIGEAESYNVGSDSQIAPYLDALMKAVANVASPLNAVIELFRKKFGDEETEEMLFESGWVETFDNLAVMIPEVRMIPMQAGNEGKPPPNTQATTGVAQATPVAQVQQTPQFSNVPVWQQQPQQQQQPAYGFQQQPAAPVVTSNGLDFASVLRSNPALQAAVGAGGRPAPQYQQGQARSAVNQALTGGGGWGGGPTSGWGPGNNWNPSSGRSGGFGTV